MALTQAALRRARQEPLRALGRLRRPARLDDPLLAVRVYEHHGSGFACMSRKDLAKTRKIGSHKYSAAGISSGTFGDAILERGIEPL